MYVLVFFLLFIGHNMYNVYQLPGLQLTFKSRESRLLGSPVDFFGSPTFSVIRSRYGGLLNLL